jgi:hypothetical protein
MSTDAELMSEFFDTVHFDDEGDWKNSAIVEVDEEEDD